MKILDIPQSGKRGLNVSQDGQFGQISRTVAKVSNPRTPSQMAVRDNLSRVAARWRALQETQRAAWMAAAEDVKSNPRLNQSGSLSGFQLFTKINCALAQFGQAQVDAPPAQPQFPALAPQNLVITNTGGVIALKLTCPSNPGDNTIVRGAKPLSQGRETCNDFRILGMCPAPAQGSADITSLYTARYGVPPVGNKVYVQVNQLVDGWESLAGPSGPSSPPGPDLPPKWRRRPACDPSGQAFPRTPARPLSPCARIQSTDWSCHTRRANHSRGHGGRLGLRVEGRADSARVSAGPASPGGHPLAQWR